MVNFTKITIKIHVVSFNKVKFKFLKPEDHTICIIYYLDFDFSGKNAKCEPPKSAHKCIKFACLHISWRHYVFVLFLAKIISISVAIVC